MILVPSCTIVDNCICLYMHLHIQGFIFKLLSYNFASYIYLIGFSSSVFRFPGSLYIIFILHFYSWPSYNLSYFSNALSLEQAYCLLWIKNTRCDTLEMIITQALWKSSILNDYMFYGFWSFNICGCNLCKFCTKRFAFTCIHVCYCLAFIVKCVFVYSYTATLFLFSLFRISFNFL